MRFFFFFYLCCLSSNLLETHDGESLKLISTLIYKTNEYSKLSVPFSEILDEMNVIVYNLKKRGNQQFKLRMRRVTFGSR